MREEIEPLPYEISFGNSAYVESGEQQEVRVVINNDSQEIMTGMSVSIQLSEKGSPEVLVEESITDMKMAPKSEMIYPLKFTSIKAGYYTIQTLVEAGGEEWHWEENFKITDEGEDNGRFDPAQSKSFSFQQLIILAISLIVGTLAIYVGMKLVS